MTIFSEIYGAYYRIAAEIMRRKNGSEGELYDIIRRFGFCDSALFLPQKLLPQRDGTDWGLLRKNSDGTLSPIIKNPPLSVLTTLQKRWLKAKLSDPRLGLFLDDDALARLENRLDGVSPLYRRKHFRYFDRFTDGDDFSDENYRRNFRIILSAIKSRELLSISFVSGHNRAMRLVCLPMKIEYSEKNDKIRVYVSRFRKDKIAGGGIVNLGRIHDVRATGRHFDGNIRLDDYFRKCRAGSPVTVYVAPERNAVERFLMEFASYEKRTERDLESGGCTVSLFYDKSDETELLIQLLSFGAAVEILAPEDFRAQAAERVRRQEELLNS